MIIVIRVEARTDLYAFLPLIRHPYLIISYLTIRLYRCPHTGVYNTASLDYALVLNLELGVSLHPSCNIIRNKG